MQFSAFGSPIFRNQNIDVLDNAHRRFLVQARGETARAFENEGLNAELI
jgi:hypothetical protein